MAATRPTSALAAVMLGMCLLCGSPARAQTPAQALSASPASPSSAAPESLPELAARVLKNDPQVRSVESLARVAEQRVRQAASRLYWPTLEAQIEHGRSNSVSLNLPIDRRTDRSQASLRWNLYNGGADKAEHEGAERDLLAAREELRRAREEVAERLAQAYAEALRHASLLPFSHGRLRELREIHDKVRIQSEAGKLSDADLVQAGTSVLEAEIDDARVRANLEASLARLRTLAGGTLGALLELPASRWGPDGSSTQSGDSAVAPGAVAAARLRAQAARARVLPESSAYTPRVDLRYDQQIHDSTRPQLTEQNRRGWQVVARWELPLGGENQSRIEESAHRAQAAEDEAERVALSLRAEGAGLPDRLRASEAAIAQLRVQDARYETLLRAAALQFEAGRRSLAQLTQLFEGRYAIQQRLADETLEVRNSRIRLAALGGGLLPMLGADSTTPAAR